MLLDPEQLAADVVQIVKSALAPIAARVAQVEARMPMPEPEVPSDDLAASFTRLLTKELGALLPVRMEKRVERDEHGNVARVIEEPVT